MVFTVEESAPPVFCASENLQAAIFLDAGHRLILGEKIKIETKVKGEQMISSQGLKQIFLTSVNAICKFLFFVPPEMSQPCWLISSWTIVIVQETILIVREILSFHIYWLFPAIKWKNQYKAQSGSAPHTQRFSKDFNFRRRYQDVQKSFMLGLRLA